MRTTPENPVRSASVSMTTPREFTPGLYRRRPAGVDDAGSDLEHAPMERQHRKSLREPDETVRFEGITEDIVEIAGFTVGRTVQEPGCPWSERDPRAKTEGVWCQARPVGIGLSGRWGADLPDGTTLEWGPDDV